MCRTTFVAIGCALFVLGPLALVDVLVSDLMTMSSVAHDKYIPGRAVHAPEATETPPEAITAIFGADAQTGSAYVTTPNGGRLVVDSVTFSSSGLQPMPTGIVRLKVKWADSRCVAGWVLLTWNENSNTVTATNANKRDEEKCP